MKQLKRFPFCIGDKVNYLVGYDLPERCYQFIESFQPFYFYQTSYSIYNQWLNNPEEIKKKEHYFATLIRSLYSQACETFLALLFGTLQAPYLIIGWMQKYKKEDISKLIKIVNEHKEYDYFKIFIPDMSWEGLSKLVNRITIEKDDDTIKYKIGLLWQSIANEYIDDKNYQEYNCIKHGFRISPGGFTLSIGDSRSNSKKGVLCGGIYGSTFQRLVKFKEAPEKEKIFRLIKTSYNWDLVCLINRMSIIGMSITNLLNIIKSVYPNRYKEIKILMPKTVEEIDSALYSRQSSGAMDIDHIIKYQKSFIEDKEDIYSIFKVKIDLSKVLK